MTRAELSDDKKREYDMVLDEMMKEIESKMPEQYHRSGQLDGKASKIYQEVSARYMPRLNQILTEA